MSETAPQSSEDVEEGVTGPPLVVLFVAVVFVVVGAGLVPVDAFGVHVLGYVIASVLTIIAVGVYRRLDLLRRLAPQYRPRPGVRRVVPGLLVASFAVAALHVWAIATELAA
jgi:hypothetical protein